MTAKQTVTSTVAHGKAPTPALSLGDLHLATCSAKESPTGRLVLTHAQRSESFKTVENVLQKLTRLSKGSETCPLLRAMPTVVALLTNTDFSLCFAK